MSTNSEDIEELEGPFEQIAAAAASPASVSSSSDGCIEVPKSIKFAGNKKWQLKKVTAEPLGTGPMSAMLASVNVRWEASVTVDCNCGNPPPLQTVNGTRVWEAELYVKSGEEVFLASNNPFPYDFAIPTSVLEGIGELIAEAIKKAFTSYVITAAFKRVVNDTVQSQVPKEPTEGEWKDQKDPCRNLKRS